MIVSFDSPNQENLSPRGLSTLFAQRQSSGDDIKSLLAQTSIELHREPPPPAPPPPWHADDASNQSCTAARQSPSPKQPPKNHCNRQALKEKQRNIKDAELERQSQEKLRLQKLETKKKKLYGKVKSRAFDPTTNDCCATSDHPPRGSSISTGSHEHNYQIAFGRKVPITDPPRPCSSTDSVASSSDTRHKSYGKVPNYILQRKAKIEQFEQEERTRRENAPPHPGLVLMEESERLETLAMLDANEREAREELRNIPFSMNEQKSARLREAIEYRLKEIEETRNIFQKEKVFLAKED